VKPRIELTRDFAHVWGPYTLDIDGKRIHCGVDSCGWSKIDGKWLLTTFGWTADPKGCPPCKCTAPETKTEQKTST
jgi:hypothetical protein